MQRGRRWLRYWAASCLVVSSMLFVMVNPAAATDEQTLERMERLIKQQQAQIEAQAKALEKLQKQVEELSQKAPAFRLESRPEIG